jgi:23S rRNA (adenine2503-C2)-methyltransferase
VNLKFAMHGSVEDASVNFVAPVEGGSLEARFVQRTPDYFITYLSSHAGCDRACRMCHLTQSGQTSMRPASFSDYTDQAAMVLKYWFDRNEPTPKFMNYNFMARGEPFANPVITDQVEFRRLQKWLYKIAWKSGIPETRMNLSTIMPASLHVRSLQDMLGRSEQGTNIYYSLYSMKPDFRRRWLPKAMDPHRALDMLAEYQQTAISGWTPGEVVLHWSFIEGQNDDLETIEEIIEAVQSRGLKTRFNLVRYNPYSPAQGEEPDAAVLADRLNRLAVAFGDPRTRMIPRVGFDVKASCGMFVNPGVAA